MLVRLLEELKIGYKQTVLVGNSCSINCVLPHGKSVNVQNVGEVSI